MLSFGFTPLLWWEPCGFREQVACSKLNPVLTVEFSCHSYFVALVYPTWESFKAIGTAAKADDTQVWDLRDLLTPQMKLRQYCTRLGQDIDNFSDCAQWLTYWVVYNLLTTLEYLLMGFFS